MSRKTDVAWAAGFLDGEGHFGVNGARGRVHPFIAATQAKYIEPLDKLKMLFGGSVHCYDYEYKNSMCTWRLGGARRLQAVLPEIIPYLVVKQGQAIQLCLLADCIVSHGRPGRRGLTDDQRAERNVFVAKIKELRS